VLMDLAWLGGSQPPYAIIVISIGCQFPTAEWPDHKNRTNWLDLTPCLTALRWVSLSTMTSLDLSKELVAGS